MEEYPALSIEQRVYRKEHERRQKLKKNDENVRYYEGTNIKVIEGLIPVMSGGVPVMSGDEPVMSATIDCLLL